MDVVGTGKFSVAVNTPAISNLTTDGFVKTTGGAGTLSVDNTTYAAYSSMTANYLQKATSTTAIGNSSIIDTGNVGIGTTTPQAKFVVTTGNVGLGTWTADNARLETDGFRLMNNGVAAGNVLVSTSTGIGTWMAASTLPVGGASGWSTGTGTVYNTTGSDNIGIGTTTPQGGLVVTNGNVGIGTWTAANGKLSVIGGNVGIGTLTTHAMMELTGDGAKEIFRLNDSGPNDTSPFIVDSVGNVGIGTVTAQGLLDATIPGSTSYLRFGGFGTNYPQLNMKHGSGSAVWTWEVGALIPN